MWLSSAEWVWRTLLKYQNESYEKAVFSDKTSGHFIWFNLVIKCVLLEFPNWNLRGSDADLLQYIFSMYIGFK